jgi:hypothetical protein
MPLAAPGRRSAAVISMALTMRPTGLGHGVYQDKVDYGIYCGEWFIGRIYETRTGPADLRWFWALHAPSKPGSMRTSNQVATLDEAKAELEGVGGEGFGCAVLIAGFFHSKRFYVIVVTAPRWPSEMISSSISSGRRSS